MAMTINPVSPLLTGAAIVKSDSSATQASAIITATTAQSSLNLSQLAIVIENYATGATCAVTIGAGENYTEIGQGAKVVTIASGATVVIGGKDFESARFQKAADTVNLSFATASTIYISAIQLGCVAWNPA